jgi:hypothetical protein
MKGNFSTRIDKLFFQEYNLIEKRRRIYVPLHPDEISIKDVVME